MSAMNASTSSRGRSASAAGTDAEALEHQNKVNDHHLVASRRCIGDTEVGVKGRAARLRHDRAINLACFTAHVGAGVEKIQHLRRALGWGREQIRGEATELRLRPLHSA